MEITVNGKKEDVSDSFTISKLLQKKKIKKDRVVIERNLEIVNKADYDNLVLQQNDTLEILHFVGGGC